MSGSPCCANGACSLRLNAATRKQRIRTTAVTAPPNGVKNAPKPTTSNQLWVSDTTYLPARQSTVCLSLVTDAFSRRIVGHHVHASLHTAGCLAVLERAVRGAGRAGRGCLHHSDRGRTR